LRHRWSFVAQQAKTKPETLVIELGSDETWVNVMCGQPLVY